jgi:fluoroquinolone resistance protein
MSLKKPIAEICTGLFCFWRVKVMDQTFENIIFNSANFFSQFQTKSECIQCSFIDLDLNAMDLSGTRFMECTFTNCNMSNVVLKKATLRNCEFTDCKLMGVDFSSLQTIVYLKFHNSSLDYSVFNSTVLKKSIFTNCSLKEADFSSAVLSGSDFSQSILSGANFSRADLSLCDFRGARDYTIEPTYTNISKAKFSLPEAMALLKSFDITVE